jgi:hypothetical protein
MSLTNYDRNNVTNTKQFVKATANVFNSIKERNAQIQQLLIIAVGEAASIKGGQVTNNLDWLTRILVLAEDTKGINLVKMVRYVKEVLCVNTVSWNSEKSRLSKVSDKKVKLAYNVAPTVSWFEHGKKETVAKAFDYGKRITSSINSAMSNDKGGLTLNEVMMAVMASDDVTIADLMEAIATVNPMQEAA